MGRKAGIPLIELFTVTDQINQVLPAGLSEFLLKFVAIDLKTRTSSNAIIYTGKLQSFPQTFDAENIEEFKFSFGSLQIPLVSTGVPFQLSQIREDIVNDLEPGAQSWQFDILLNDLTLVLDGLIGADYIAGVGTVPRHLVPKEGNPPTAITGSAGMRFERANADQPVTVRLFDPISGSDPFIPMQQSGMIFNVTCTPPHFLIGKSQFGMSLQNLMFDYSHEYSPPQILERGQSADWVGLAIKEATLYLPPNALGGSQFSAGLENFLIGDPAGLQGELEIQFGQSPLKAGTFTFTQDGNPVTFDFGNGTLIIEALPDEEVFIIASMTAFGPPPGDSDITGWEAEFKFPGKDAVVQHIAGGLVKHGSKIKITPIEIIGTGTDERRLRKPTFTVKMVASGVAPKVSLLTDNSTFDNIVELTGPKEKLEALELIASSSPASTNTKFKWTCEKLGINHEGTSLTLTINPEHSGKYVIKVIEVGEAKASTHIRIHVRDAVDEELYIGCETGVFAHSDLNNAVDIANVLGTYDLGTFHEKGELEGADAQAIISDTNASVINIPDGAIAETSINEGVAAAVVEENRHVQILFPHDKSNPPTWRHDGHKQPWGNSGSSLEESLLEWATKFPDAKFQIIGRCDDVSKDTPRNRQLAIERAESAKNKLTTGIGGFTPIGEGNILALGEQTGVSASLLTDSIGLITLSIESISEIDEDEKIFGRLIIKNKTSDDFPKNGAGNGITTNPPNPPIEDTRHKYRRADIYAIGGTAVGSERRVPTEALAPTHRRVLVPASGRTALPSNNDAPNADYRVKLNLGWDKPRFKGWSDIVPNLAEFEYAWTPSGDTGISTTSEVLTFYGGYVFDDLTGFTDVTLGLKSEGDPDGLAKTEQPNLVAALAFGPMLASGVDFDDHVFGSAVRLGALGTIAGFASADLGSGKKLISNGSKSALIAFEAHAQTRTVRDPLESFKTQLTVDYTNTLHINGGVLGLKTDPAQPMKLRYSKVGVEFDNSNPDASLINKIGFAYTSDSMTIEDSGLWKIDGPLGKLLRISEFKMGVGSFWIEPTLALALDISVVEISEASFRITFDIDSDGEPILPPGFSLRGLKAKVDIPKTLKGEGRLKIEDRGVIKAGIDMDIIPLQVKASVALAVGRPPEIAPAVFLSLFAKVQFPGGIPLGTLPIAIHGFVGQTVINGSRDINPVSDVVTREIGWWRKDPEEKYKPQKSQHALGLGVILGTLPDASFSLSVMGMVVVAFPDPEVILGVEVNLLSIPDVTAKDKKDGTTASITGLVVISPEALIIAISAQYEIPKILKLNIPFGAYFPEPDPDKPDKNVYIRLGADGIKGRTGAPITITFLPDTLNVKAWAYLMIEGGGIQKLGDEPGWDFDGFAIGFGAGIALDWSAGRIGLSASAKLLVGVGTAPLIIKGGLFVKGKLDLVVISISVRGDIVLTYIQRSENNSSLALKGCFCGEVDMFFFSLKGCVDFSVVADTDFKPGPPPPPVASITLTDRINAVMGEANTSALINGAAIFDFVEVAMLDEHGNPKMDDDGNPIMVTKNQGVSPKDNHVVWPDTVPVLNFSHYIKDALSSTGQFNPDGQPAGEAWFGSSRLKYAYRLDAIRLVRKDGELILDPSGEKLLSSWDHTAFRPSDNTSGGGSSVPSGSEAVRLHLLAWKPSAWAESTSNGGEGQPGDPVDMIDRICEPVPEPQPACLLGEDVNILSMSRSLLRRNIQSQGPYPSKFRGMGESFFAINTQVYTGTALRTLLSSMGSSMTAGQIVSTMDVIVKGVTLHQGYRLPGIEVTHTDTMSHMPLPWRVKLDRDVQQGELTLLVCQDIKQHEEDDCYMFNDMKAGIRGIEFDLKAFKIFALKPNALLRTMDAVDALSANLPRLGQDNQVDMFIPEEGAFIQFKDFCKSIKIYFYALSKGTIKFTIHHSNGDVKEEVLTARDAGFMHILLHSTSTITAIQMELEFKGIHLYKICCIGKSNPPISEEKDCLTFEKLSRALDKRHGFTFNGFKFSALDSTQVIRQSDFLDTQQNPTALHSDGTPEILIPSNGLEITFSKPCQKLSIHVFLGASAIKVIGVDKTGKSIPLNINIQGEKIREYSIEAQIALQSIIISGGSNEAALYKICCLDKKQTCIDFSKLNLRKKTSKFTYEDLVFMDSSGEPNLMNVDTVKKIDTTFNLGNDGISELRFGKTGLTIHLPSPVNMIELLFFVEKGTAYEVIALDKNANEQNKQSGIAKKETLQVNLSGNNITMVIVKVDEKAILLKVCFEHEDKKPTIEREKKDLLIPAVNSIDRDGATIKQDWNGKIIATHTRKDGRICNVVRYRSPDPLTVFDQVSVELFPVTSSTITMMSLCGVDQRSALWHDSDQDVRDDLVDGLSDTDDASDAGRPVLLHPNTTYRIEVDWSWQVWSGYSDDDSAESDGCGDTAVDTNSNAPDVPNPADWETGESQSFQFKTASEETDIPNRQDGANEYIFDPRDLDRYLLESEPLNGAIAHFTDDPIVFHFSQKHIANLLEQFGREFDIEICRTDPPPQPNGDFSAVVAPIPGELFYLGIPLQYYTVADARMYKAIQDSPCLPNDPSVLGGVTLAGVFDLLPNVMYDADLMARKISNTLDKVSVHAVNFRTSRYANPKEMIEAMGCSTDATVSPFPPAELILDSDATVPNNALPPSDREFDISMQNMGLDTLALPINEPRIFQVWRPNTDGSNIEMVALLIDAVEPVNRMASVIIGNKVEIVNRCQLINATIDGISFEVVRMTRNSTRLLLVPTSAFVAPVDPNSLELHFATYDGSITGRKFLRSIPLTIELEGF